MVVYKMKILLLSPNQLHRYNWGHQLFRNEIGKQTPVKYYGERFPGYNANLLVKQIINKKCEWTPDLILTYGWRYSLPFQGLGSITDIPKVHITVDYGRPEGIPLQNEFFSKNKYDLVFAITLNAERLLKKNNVCDNIQMLPFSVDTNVYKSMDVPKKNQILAAFTTRQDIYPNRTKAQIAARQTGYPVITKRVIQQKLINSINRSKICITSNNIFRSLSMRYTEVMACGGFLLADKPEDMEFLGFIDKKHFVVYNGMPDLKKKIKYYMTHDKMREKIAKQGMDFVRKNHSCTKRVHDMLHIINKELGI